MKLDTSTIKQGTTLVYNDGRAGHTSAECVVVSVSESAMCVQFADRADTTTIRFNDSAWMQFLTVKPANLQTFKFNPALTSAQRDNVVLIIRKQGFYAYHETGFDGETMTSDIPLHLIPLTVGNGFSLSPINN